jgi:hypothetical protein
MNTAKIIYGNHFISEILILGSWLIHMSHRSQHESLTLRVVMPSLQKANDHSWRHRRCEMDQIKVSDAPGEK